MPENRPPRRNRREIAAEATRREIVAAARRLFAREGYAATSISQLAAEAGVAVQTVYSSVGSKAALLLALNDLIDEDGGVGEFLSQVERSADPQVVLRAAVRLTRGINERCGDIVQVLQVAEPTDADVAAAVADGNRRHRQGASLLARRLDALHTLVVGLEEAEATFATMTAPASWRALTQDFGWSFDRAEARLVLSLEILLCGANAGVQAAPSPQT